MLSRSESEVEDPQGYDNDSDSREELYGDENDEDPYYDEEE